MRRRPLLWLLRHYVGAWIVWLGDKIEGDYRYETISGPDEEGAYIARPVPASWQPDPPAIREFMGEVNL